MLLTLIGGKVGAGFLAAVVAVGALSALTRQKHALILAGVLFFSWAITKIIAHFYDWDTARTVYPPAHLLALAVIMPVWAIKPEPWKLGVGFAVLTALFLDARYWWFLTPHTTENTYNYILALNILFAIEILCVSIAGGRVVGEYLGDRVSVPRAGHRGMVSRGRRSASRKTSA